MSYFNSEDPMTESNKPHPPVLKVSAYGGCPGCGEADRIVHFGGHVALACSTHKVFWMLPDRETAGYLWQPVTTNRDGSPAPDMLDGEGMREVHPLPPNNLDRAEQIGEACLQLASLAARGATSDEVTAAWLRGAYHWLDERQTDDLPF